MKLLTLITTCVFMLFMYSPTSSHAEKKNVERSTSLGTGLPISKERYERKQLTPKPTKKPTTDYEIVDDGDESSDETLATNSSTQNQNNNVGNEQTTPSKTQNDIAAPTTKINKTNEQALNSLPQTGVQKNYPAIIGTVIVILAILLFFIFRKKRK